MATEYPHVSNNKPDGKETIQGHLEVVKQRINPADGTVHSSLMHSHFAACINECLSKKMFSKK